MNTSGPLPYFAYGSNMSTAQMAQRCPGASEIGVAALRDHRFIINSRGYATVADTGSANDALADPASPQPAHKSMAEPALVLGVLWDVTDAHLASLDGFEGVAAGRYLRQQATLWVHGADGTERAVEAILYRDPITTVGPPKPDYLERVIDGARSHKVDRQYIDQVLNSFFS